MSLTFVLFVTKALELKMFIFFLKTLAPSFFFCEFRIFGADVLSIRPLNWHLVSMQHHAINYYETRDILSKL